MSSRSGVAVLAIMLLGGCSDPAANVVGAADAGAGDADGSVACAAPTTAPPWLQGYLTENVSKLSGEAEISAGVRLTDRATPARRQAARSYLQGELGALGLTTSLHDYGGGANVVGRLAATSGGTEWIVVGAHFDSVDASPGANDNATGVSTVLAVARILKDVPCRNRGVMFVMFDQEEIGLIGSKAFAKQQLEAGTSIHAVHTVDQVGWDRDGDLRFEIELPSDALFAEYQAGATAVEAKVVRTTTPDSDHSAFRERGFAAAGITEEYVNGDTTPHVHMPGDKPMTIAVGYQALAVRLVTYVVARELGAE